MEAEATEVRRLTDVAQAELVLGDLPRARALVERALSANAHQYVPLAIAPLCLIVGSRLDDVPLLARFADTRTIDAAFAIGTPQHVGRVAAAFSEHFIASQRFPEARALMRRGLGALDDVAPAPWLAVLAAEHGGSADLRRARALTERWDGVAAERRRPAHLTLIEAFARRRQRRDHVALAREAAGRFASLGFPYEAAAALELAEDFNDALALYREIGDVRDERRVEKMLGRRRGGPLQLTAREEDVARLIVAGRSNREIGDALAISPRTVENHVASIFVKLGVSSRVQLAMRYIAGRD